MAYSVSVDRPWSLRREQIIADLEQQPGKDLIIVQYAPQHSPHEEWVYNGANIDDASVVSARDLESVKLTTHPVFSRSKFSSGGRLRRPQRRIPLEAAGITRTATGRGVARGCRIGELTSCRSPFTGGGLIVSRTQAPAVQKVSPLAAMSSRSCGGSKRTPWAIASSLARFTNAGSPQAGSTCSGPPC